MTQTKIYHGPAPKFPFSKQKYVSQEGSRTKQLCDLCGLDALTAAQLSTLSAAVDFAVAVVLYCYGAIDVDYVNYVDQATKQLAAVGQTQKQVLGHLKARLQNLFVADVRACGVWKDLLQLCQSSLRWLWQPQTLGAA